MKNFIIISMLAAASLTVHAQNNSMHTPQGALVKIFTNYTGDKIKLNDVVTLQMIQKTDKDSVLGSTYAMGHPIKIQVQPSKNIGDLMEVFPLLTAKDSAYVNVPADSIFKGHEDQRPPFFPKGSGVVFIIRIDKVQSLNDAIVEKNEYIDKAKADETAGTAKYIADNKLIVKTTPSGLKYFITRPSLKAKPLPGDTALVNYTGRTIDGKVFDSSIQADALKAGLNQPGRNYEPISVVVGTGAVIKGWDEGLLLLNEGSKAQFIIPSGLAYGEAGQGDIQPFSTLVFDVELVKIKPIKHAATKPVMKKKVVKKHKTVKKSS